MRAVLQRVLQASVSIEGQTVCKIDKGLLVYLGVAKADGPEDADFLAKKIVELRIFEDEAGKMNRSVIDVKGSILLVSNFTLCGNCRKGRRPSFDDAAKPEVARELYEKVVSRIASLGVHIETGLFQEHMHIESLNDGPVTFVLDS